MNIKLSVLFFVCFGCATLVAQIPSTNIYLFDMEQVNDTLFEFSNPKFLTQFNNGGYNNQPYFLNENELFITVRRPNDDQTEIYALDLEQLTRRKVTETDEGEYSAKLTPNSFLFSAVREEFIEGDTIRRLWEFPVAQDNDGKPVFKYINDIGYYEWLNSREVAVYLTQNPSKLSIANTVTDQLDTIATNVGRCFKLLPNGNLAFVKKTQYEGWTIMQKKLNRYQRDSDYVPIIKTLEGSEDFEILNDGSIIMAQGSKLFRHDPYFGGNEWVEMADLRLFGVRNISRIAVNFENQIAIVSE